ncbi:MAG: amidohydrolase [Clostridiales Family XIII bacterium]|jgi:predicted amidohydrolase YtcJ|nr:amidohydrolase [Clostridiales Family XIII bacterium]
MIIADKIFINGNIHTMEKPGDRAAAVVVYKGEIVYVGSDAGARAYSAKETVDLNGKTMLPGFTDTHMHLIADCMSKAKAELGGARSVAEVVSIMKDFAAETDAEWLLGGNLHIENMAEGRFPHRYELDAIDARPVILFSYCYHAQIANSEALRRAGIAKGFRPEMEGLVDFYDDGEPNGVIHENTYGLHFANLVDGDMALEANRKSLLKKYLTDYTKRGITSLQTFSALSEDPLEYVNQYMDLDREGALPVRVAINSAGSLDRAYHAVSGFGNDKIRIGAKKLFCDGSLGTRTAALLAPYCDAPDEKGLLVHSQDELTALVGEAYDYGCDIAIHAIGDGAMEFVLNAIESVLDARAYDDAGVAVAGPLDEAPEGFREAAARKYRGRYPRFRIIHASLIDPSHTARIARLPVILDVQPSFVRNWHSLAEARVGKERSDWLYPLRTFTRNGILLTGGSDAPVEPSDPLMGIQVAVTRSDLGGVPAGGFIPREKLDVFDAVALYTRNAAYCTHEEDRKGTITEGRLADLIVLSDDIFAIDPQRIAATRVEQVYLGGERVL